MSVHESGEMYLEAILVLSQSRGFVRSVDVGEYLGYSKPSVSRAMGILRRENYIIMDKDGAITLTDGGRRIAEMIYERHTLLSKLLIHLGVSEETAASVIPKKDTLVLVYCRSGRRSKLAAEALTQLGYSNVKEFGGIIDWPYETE